MMLSVFGVHRLFILLLLLLLLFVPAGKILLKLPQTVKLSRTNSSNYLRESY